MGLVRSTAHRLTKITFIVEEAVFRQDEPSFSPELEPLTSLFVEPALERHLGRV